eukprot:s1847_g8.t1
MLQPRPVPSGNADDPEAGGSRAMSMQQGYHSSRAEAVQSVQKTIGELAQMFQKMAVMVTAQEEMIQRIDHDLDDTLDNATKAQEQYGQFAAVFPLHFFEPCFDHQGLLDPDLLCDFLRCFLGLSPERW